MKQIEIKKMTSKELKNALQEAELLKILDHPKIIEFEEVRTTKLHIEIVTEYAAEGDLLAKIRSQRGELFSEDQILNYLVQICIGINYIHNQDIIHRDIKPANIFLTGNGNIKIGDLGIAKVLDNSIRLANSTKGTPCYVAPEIIYDKNYNNKCDVWSLGVLVYELCALQLPLVSYSSQSVINDNVIGEVPPLPQEFSSALQELVTWMLTLNPSKRPDICDVIKHRSLICHPLLGFY